MEPADLDTLKDAGKGAAVDCLADFGAHGAALGLEVKNGFEALRARPGTYWPQLTR